MHGLGLLPPVAAALPGEHGPRVAGRRGRPAGLVQPAVAVAQQGAGQLREAQVEEGEHEQLVPEHMPPVGLAVQAPGRDAHIQAELRDGLEEVEGVQVDDLGQVVIGGEVDAAPAPQVAPGQGVAIQQLLERTGHAGRPLPGRREGFADGHVLGGEQRRHLLHHDLFAPSDIDPEALLDIAVALAVLGWQFQLLAVAEQSGPGRGGDADVRLVGLHLQPHHLPVVHPASKGAEMDGAQSPVTLHPGVAHRGVQAATNLQAALPVLGHHRGLQTGQMGVAHADKAAGGDLDHPALGVPPAGAAHQHTPIHVQLLIVRQDLAALAAEPLATLGPKRQRQPVGRVDQTLVLHHPARHLSPQPVVHPSHIRARIMHAVRGGLRGRPPGGEIPVTQSAQRLPLALPLGIPTLIHPQPLVPIRRHRSPW